MSPAMLLQARNSRALARAMSRIAVIFPRLRESAQAKACGSGGHAQTDLVEDGTGTAGFCGLASPGGRFCTTPV